MLAHEIDVSWAPTRVAMSPTSPKVLKQRLSIQIHRISTELPHSRKLESRNPVGPWRIPIELSLSYEEGSRQAGRHSGPQSLATLPTKLCLATTLRMRALQVEFPKCGVCVDFHHEGSIYRCEWDLHRLGEVSLVPRGGRLAGQATWTAGRVEQPPPTVSTNSGFSSSCRRVATKSRPEPP
jgi:hypothetical protein